MIGNQTRALLSPGPFVLAPPSAKRAGITYHIKSCQLTQLTAAVDGDITFRVHITEVKVVRKKPKGGRSRESKNKRIEQGTMERGDLSAGIIGKPQTASP